MTNKNKNLNFIALFILFFIFSQTDLELQNQYISSFEYNLASEYCAIDQLALQHPDLLLKTKQIDEQLYSSLVKKSRFSPPYVLPVVVHIIHQNGAENISDTQVLQGINDLNEAFANINYYDQNTGIDTQIEFCLAKQTPEGAATNGINRVNSDLTNLTLETEDLNLKNLIRWNAEQYINIWLVAEICSNSSGCGVAGYAYFPSAHGSNIDGIVQEARWFGSNSSNSAVQVHEMGHYLGLKHTFQGGCNNNDCLTDGDQVCDTPPDNSVAAVPCGGSVNSCNTDIESGFVTDQNDMFWNYMDYGDWDCYSAFTEGQADRMHWHIENIRSSLLESSACNDPCTVDISSNFTPSINQVIEVGTDVNFINTSTDANNYEWKIDQLTFATTANSNFTFNTLGTYEISLLVTNDDPNCSDEFSVFIEVTCPLNIDFTSSNLFPFPEETVNFTNHSTGATSYEWQINGITESSNQNFDHVFPSQGIYTVCLNISNNLCEENLCQTIFVSDEQTNDCETTFVKTIGTGEEDERGFKIISTPDGGFIAGASKGDSVLLILLDAATEIIWQRSFQIIESSEISDLIIDSDGYLVGTGYSPANANRESFVFKYDYINNIMLWIKQLTSTNLTKLTLASIIQDSNSGNYFVCGETWNNTGPGLGCDALMLEIEQNTGSALWNNSYNLGSCESFWKLLPLGNSIYAFGRNNNAGGGQAEFRGAITQFDLLGNQTWSKLYIAPTNQTARLYAVDAILDNGIVTIGHGSLFSTNANGNSIQLFKTDYSGEIQWARNYEISTNSGSEFSDRILNLPDGYLLLGRYQINGEYSAFIMKTNKEGDVLWSKKFGGSLRDAGYDMLYHNGFIHIIGESESYGLNNTKDIFLAKLKPDGSISNECELLVDIDVNGVIMNNPYDGSHPMTKYQANLVLEDQQPNIQEAETEEKFECFTPCMEGDSCLLFSDASLVINNTFCLGDSLQLGIEICNLGNGLLSSDMPISFYDNDPFSGPANLLLTTFLNQNLELDSCVFLSVKIPAVTTSIIFAIANDNGSTSPPFNLEDEFPNSVFSECDFSSNSSNITIDFLAPILDLGLDTTMCDNATLTFDAGAGFYSYQWFNGTTEQFFTSWEAGTYWVITTDSCGGIQVDSITVSIVPETILELNSDTTICPGMIELSASGFDHYQWFPSHSVNCDTCSSVTAIIDTTSVIQVIAEKAPGCYSVDSILIETYIPYFTNDTILECSGDTVTIFGTPTSLPGDYTEIFTSSNGCDSTHTITLLFTSDTIFTDVNVDICLGDSIDIYGNFENEAGVFVQIDSSSSCIKIETTYLNLSAPLNLTFHNEDISCFGEQDGSIFIETLEEGMSYSIDGENFQAEPYFNQLEAGHYQLLILSSEACESSYSFDISEPDELILTVPEDQMIHLGESLTISPYINSIDTIQYLWSPSDWLSCDTCPEVFVSPWRTINYSLLAINEDGCSAQDDITIFVDTTAQVFIPNVFSPNNDGVNDFFFIHGGNDVDKIKQFLIFNRWGGLVYEAKQIPPNSGTHGWDGKFNGELLNSSVFIFFAEIRFIDGRTEIFKGDILLIR